MPRALGQLEIDVLYSLNPQLLLDVHAIDNPILQATLPAAHRDRLLDYQLPSGPGRVWMMHDTPVLVLRDEAGAWRHVDITDRPELVERIQSAARHTPEWDELVDQVKTFFFQLGEAADVALVVLAVLAGAYVWRSFR